jgi:hypothetical protein
VASERLEPFHLLSTGSDLGAFFCGASLMLAVATGLLVVLSVLNEEMREFIQY